MELRNGDLMAIRENVDALTQPEEFLELSSYLWAGTLRSDPACVAITKRCWLLQTCAGGNDVADWNHCVYNSNWALATDPWTAHTIDTSFSHHSYKLFTSNKIVSKPALVSWTQLIRITTLIQKYRRSYVNYVYNTIKGQKALGCMTYHHERQNSTAGTR